MEYLLLCQKIRIASILENSRSQYYNNMMQD